MRRHLIVALVVGLVAATTVACTPPIEPEPCPNPSQPPSPSAGRAAVAREASSGGQPPPLDQVIRPAAPGLSGRPDLARAVAAPARASDISTNELTFTYNSPDNPWSPAELQQLQQIVATSYPIIKDVVGSPLFPITVNFRKDPSLPSTVAGQFWPGLNEIKIRVLNPDTFIHEMIHAFRDDLVLWDDAFEEGMTRAAEVAVMGRMPAQYSVGYFDAGHSYQDDVNYELFKGNHAVGSVAGEFWTDRDPALVFIRYQLSGYAWAKAYIEDPQFFARFDAALYQASLTNPSVVSDEGALVGLAAGVAPTVESRPFEQWYHEQSIFETSPPTGDLLMFRNLPPFGTTLHALTRAGDGTETALGGLSVDWSAVNFFGGPFDGGTATTDAVGNADVPVVFPSGFAGRTGLTATATDRPDASTIANIRWTQGSGVFGTVPRDHGGYVEVQNLDTSARACATLAQGAFDVASLGVVRGRFSATVHYDDGVTATKRFNKDAAPYFVSFGAGWNN